MLKADNACRSACEARWVPGRVHGGKAAAGRVGSRRDGADRGERRELRQRDQSGTGAAAAAAAGQPCPRASDVTGAGIDPGREASSNIGSLV